MMNEITYLHLLPGETMLSNSHAWLENPDIVQAVESHPIGFGVFTEMRSVHGNLSEALDLKQQLATKLMEMTRSITLADGEHDSYLRAIYNLLTGLAEAAENPAEAARFLAVRDMLFPLGLGQTKQSYAQEHGAVVKCEERMTPDVQQLLQQTQVGSRTLWDLYQRWVAAGKQLGVLTKERSRIAESALLRSAGAPTHLREARYAWLRVVRMFIGAIGFLGLDAEVERALFAPLRRDVADTLAAMRARAEGSGEDLDELPGFDDGAEGDVPDIDGGVLPDIDEGPLPEPAPEESPAVVGNSVREAPADSE